MAFEILRAGRPRRTWQAGCALLVLGAASVVGGLFQTTSSAPNGGNVPCPSGTHLVAKFNYGGQYVFEKPAGSESVVTITGGSATGGDWSSTEVIGAIVVKGGPGAVIATLTPPATSGTFSNADLPEGGGGKAPDISNIQFCGPDVADPTTTTAVEETTSSTAATTTTAVEETTSSTAATTTTAVEETTTTKAVATTTTEPEATTTTVEATTTTEAEATTTTGAEETTTTGQPRNTTTSEATTTTVDDTTTTTAPNTFGTGVTVDPDATTTTAGPSTAQTPTTATPTTAAVTPSTIVVVSETDTPSSGTGTLPFTGGPSSTLVVLGTALVGVGLALTVVGGRRDRRSRS